MFRTSVARVATLSGALALTAGATIAGLGASPASAGGVPGVTATSITIGATVPLTGIASPGYSEVGKAARAVFNWVNTHGKVNGRKINYVLADDCYNTPGFGCEYPSPSTVNQTKALLALPVFATVGSLGTPTQDLVRSLLNSSSTPQLFVNSGSRDWNNQSTYPMLFGWQDSYITESKILGTFIKSHYAGKKVCWLGQSDDFGTDGLIGLQDVGVNPAVQHPYSVPGLVVGGAAYFTPFISDFQTQGCQIVYLDTIPAATAAALGNATALHYAPQWVISSVGADPITVNTVLKNAIKPDPEIGAVSFAYLNASTDKTANSLLWRAWDTKVLLADKKDFPKFTAKSPIDGNMAYGIAWGVAFVEALHAAGKNFTQASFVHLLENTTFAQTPSLTPLRYTTANHQGLLGGYVVRIASPTSTSVLSPTIQQADSTVAGPVTTAPVHSKGKPSWLK